MEDLNPQARQPHCMTTGKNPPQAPIPGQSASWWLTALGIIGALGMLILGSVALLDSRNDTWRQAEQSAQNLLLALDRDISRNLAILDLSLQGVSEALAEPGLDQATPAVRHIALFDRSASAEDLGSILVLDRNGKVIEDSTALKPHSLNLGDRDYFKVHQDRPNIGLYISRPFKSRIANGDLRFAISRRLTSPDGQFAGIVEGALRLNYFQRLFEKLEVGSKGTITLFRSDGRILTRYPFAEEDVDRDFSNYSTFRHLSQTKAGQFTSNSGMDGIERLYTYRQVGQFPVILTVNLSTDEIFAPWRRKAIVIGPVLALLCASAVASCLLFQREVRRRALTESALAKAAEQLSVIAATDGLTGVANRRSFDLAIDRAFRRSVRNGTPLSLLLLDADFFKKYNDNYGHQAGDDVLKEIASCVARNVRRPDDLAARYGGEEFVALLPDTELRAAQKIAETIRAEIDAREMSHSHSPLGRVTVSIGIAAVLPLIGDDWRLLVQAADTALYTAKREGRNCTRTASVSAGNVADLFPCPILNATS